MKTLLPIIEQLSNYTSNLGLKFWLWAFETIIHRFYSEGFGLKQKKLHFTRPNETTFGPYLNSRKLPETSFLMVSLPELNNRLR
jgi:hypothetical protein